MEEEDGKSRAFDSDGESGPVEVVTEVEERFREDCDHVSQDEAAGGA